MVAKPSKKQLDRWNQPGSTGFWAWVDDIQPHILGADRKYHAFKPEPWQRQIIEDVLQVKADGSYQHTVSLVCMPRRHSKSTLFALIVLWKLTSLENQTVQLLGTTEDHSRRVQLGLLKRIIKNTPKLSARIPQEHIIINRLTVEAMDSIAQCSGSSFASAFGDSVSLLWASDFHQVEQPVFDALSASLLDSRDTLTLIDANIDPEGGPVHTLEAIAGTDPGIYVHRTEYQDIADYCANAPAWIDREKATRQQKIQLPSAFDRDILGKRSAAANGLFTPETIVLCRSEFPHPFPPEKLLELTAGRKYVIGGGLDRADGVEGGDASLWTVTLKTSLPDGDSEYFVLSQSVFEVKGNTIYKPSDIKEQVIKDHALYKLDAVTLEDYNTVDLIPWLQDQGIPTEKISPSTKNQSSSLIDLHRIAKEGRLHFSNELSRLASEMGTFIYRAKGSAGQYWFGHSSDKFHDDCVYSLNWSVFATRANVLKLYTLPRLVCDNKSPRRSFCFLFGGDAELFCKERCAAYHKVKDHWRNYSRLRDDGLTLPAFFKTYVKVTGPRVYQSV